MPTNSAPNNVNFPNGIFVEETNVWDQIGNLDVRNPEDLRLLFTRLYQNVNLISVALNLKDSGIFDNSQEFITGMNYFPLGIEDLPEMRPVYRTTVIVPGGLANTGSTSVAHQINPNAAFKLVRCYGGATDPVNLLYTPIPNQDIKVAINATNITITTLANYSTYTVVYCVLEYLKN
jgi:hypothetical protein